jgi:hypothetical protein
MHQAWKSISPELLTLNQSQVLLGTNMKNTKIAFMLFCGVLSFTGLTLASRDGTTFLYRCNFSSTPPSLICSVQGTMCPAGAGDTCSWGNTFAVGCNNGRQAEDLHPTLTSKPEQTTVFATGDDGGRFALVIPKFDRTLGVYNASLTLSDGNELLGICNIEPARASNK